jgi:hypothetical protein
LARGSDLVSAYSIILKRSRSQVLAR